MSDYNVSHNIGKDYWAKNIGYIAKERALIALLINERPSVNKLFDVLVSQAYTKPQGIATIDGKMAIWDVGTRKWGLRYLSKVARMSINTIRYGLNRLVALGLIKKVSNKLGTIIQALKFHQYRRKNPNIGQTQEFISGNPLTQRGDTPVSQNDPYRRDLNTIK